MRDLTPKQRLICDFIQAFTRDYGYPPTIREIGTGLDLKSTSTVKFHLDNLRARGVLQWDDGKTRSLTLLEAPEKPPRDQVPLVGQVAAGAPILAQEHIEDYVPFATGPHPEDYFALTVRGESMVRAGILPGDIVVVHRQPQAHSGEIVVALLEDEATVKTLSLQKGAVWLLPENPDYDPIDGTCAQILGKVVGLVRRY